MEIPRPLQHPRHPKRRTPNPKPETPNSSAHSAPARAAYPGHQAIQFIPPPRPGRTAEVQLRPPAAKGRQKLCVFIDPRDGRILGSIDDATRPMRILHDLHGTLLAGAPGEILVELAASWTFVLLVTGVYLWWPRPFTLRGFLLPRLGSGTRALLRDLHAVPALWLCGLTLFLLATGMQWSRVGGTWTRTLAQLVGEWQPRETPASAHRSELLGGWSPYLNSKAKAEQAAAVSSAPPPAEPTATDKDCPPPRPITLVRVMELASAARVTDPYAIALPRGERGVYSILTDRDRAFTRAYVHLDQYSGKTLADIRYKDFGLIAKFSAFGIIAHEGQLFGLANQLLGLTACLGIILLAVTGLAMWWTRRPAAARQTAASASVLELPRPIMVITLVLAVLLPLVAASLVLLFVFDLLTRRRKG